VNRLSISSLTTTLRQTRDAVNALPGRQEPFASCPKGSPNLVNPKPVKTKSSFGLR
jgi:hypothetical protein